MPGMAWDKDEKVEGCMAKELGMFWWPGFQLEVLQDL